MGYPWKKQRSHNKRRHGYKGRGDYHYDPVDQCVSAKSRSGSKHYSYDQSKKSGYDSQFHGDLKSVSSIAKY